MTWTQSIIGCALLICSSADAATSMGDASWTISAKVRLDVDQSKTQSKSDGTPTQTESYSGISMKNAEFKLSGEQAANKLEISYLALSNTLENATVSHKFSDSITAVFGKMYLMFHSWEWDYSTSDQFVNSMALATTPSFTDTGAQLNLSFGDHTLSFQTVEGTSSLSKTDGTQVTFQKRGHQSSAFQYRGEFNKLIRPLLTYTEINTSSNTGSDGKNYGNGYQTHFGFGLQFLIDETQIETEIAQAKTHKLKDDPSETNKDTVVQSLVVHAKYRMGATTPFIKLIADDLTTGMSQAQIDAGSDGDLSGKQFAIGFEHRLDNTCRFHAFVHHANSSTKIAAGNSKKVTKNAFNFGVTAAM